MPELRHDPIQRRWVIIADERTRRPIEVQRDAAARDPEAFCPFCPGNEQVTAPTIRQSRPAHEDPVADWGVRVIPNKYPVLQIEGELERQGVGLFDRMNGIGAHEVVIETPRHDHSIADMSYAEVDAILAMYGERLSDLYRDGRFKYVLVFKNHGEKAGASLSHPHSQIIATPVTPLTMATELSNAREHYQLKERCLFCDVIAQELEAGERVVWADTSFVVLAPYASRFPFELTILPRQHSCTFIELSSEERGALARVLRDTLRRLKICLDDPPYNFMLHSSPNLVQVPGMTDSLATMRYDYHWHLKVIPRLTRMAGFEWGTGFYINPTAPEIAAQFLRRVHPIETSSP